MDEIPEIGVRTLDLPIVPPYLAAPSHAVPNAPAVTLYIGAPIIDLPGCVEYHPGNRKSENLKTEDPNKTITLCPDGSVPSYQPMDYVPEDLTFIKEANVPDYKATDAPPPTPPKTDIPEIPQPDTEVPCPGPNSPRIGDIAQNKTEKVSGFELSEDKQTCIVLYEDIGIVEQYLPAPQLVTTTAAIATVATGSALLAKPLADLLLKVLKPTIKKVMGKIQKVLGKEQKELSLRERKLLQRERNRAIMELRRMRKGW